MTRKGAPVFEFISPWWLVLVIFLPMHFFWRRFLGKRGQREIRYSSLDWLLGHQRTWRVKSLGWLPWIKRSALLLVILALSRPALLNHLDVVKMEGIDILLCLDVSESMKSLDFEPLSRLEVAKKVISDFIGMRQNDRIGLVLFAGNSFTKCPLTIDYDVLRFGLNDSQPGTLQGGTALGMALATSVSRIRHSKARSRVIIFLTDGVNNTGEIDPLDAMRIARDFQVKVYTVGVGKRGQARVPVYNALAGRMEYFLQEVVIDEEILKKIANVTGGLYFRATDPDSFATIFSEIDRWEKSEVSSRKLVVRNELAIYFLLSGLILLLVTELAGRTVLRTLP
jgi:Ca-activated chloride channel family protein